MNTSSFPPCFLSTNRLPNVLTVQELINVRTIYNLDMALPSF